MPETLTSTTSQAPWAAQSPYLTSGFQAAQNLYLPGGTPAGYQWFTDPTTGSRSTVSPLTQETTNLVGSVTNLANQPNILNPAEDYARAAMSGQYLTPESNPYLAQMATAASQAARDQFLTSSIPGLSSRFGMSGRTGSPGMGSAYEQLSAGYGRGIADIATNIYGTAYENERQRQQEMAMFAPDLLQARTGMYGAALDAQDILNEQSQRELTDRYNRFMFEQEAPSKALDRYLRSVSGQFGQETTQTQQVFKPEQWTNILGGVLALQQSGLLTDILDTGGDFVDWITNLFGNSSSPLPIV